MKKVVLMIFAIALCLLAFSGCDQKSNENDPLPPLSALSEYSEEQLNEILADYTMFDIHAAWGMPETLENITLHCDIYRSVAWMALKGFPILAVHEEGIYDDLSGRQVKVEDGFRQRKIIAGVISFLGVVV